MTCALAIAGALVASVVSLPAGALVGACLAVALAAAAGAPVGMDNRLRNAAFTTIGLSLGSSVGPDILHQTGAWIGSLALLLVSVAATLGAGTFVLERVVGADRDTAVLSSSPGTMSVAVAMAVEGRGDASTVLFMQSFRMLFLVTAVPLLVAALGIAPSDVVRPPAMPLAWALAMLALALLVGRAVERRRLPAAYLLAGLVLSALLHATAVADGSLPGWMIFLGFAVTGGTLGVRVRSLDLPSLARLGLAGMVSMISTVLITLVCAGLAASLTGLPFGQVWVAYAPGAVEAMAAIGSAFGYDPAYVALHHVVRIFALLALVPLALSRR
ncbi:AbrB family transcriptional regulator [Rhodobacter sp. NSM]